MTEVTIANESIIRVACFLGVFVVIAVWEILFPKRHRAISRWIRWPNNLGIVALNTGLLRIFVPAAAVGVALIAEHHHWGLMNQWDIPGWVSVALAVLVLDLAIYLQHILFHAVPALWRLHRMHHADLDFDVTTGARFHPIEILLSMGIKMAAVAAFGIPVVAVVLFEVLLNATSMFNHGNIRIPLKIDKALRWVVVTPDMHRVHHSIVPQETNSNFGFSLPWWDRLLGTYRDQPAGGHDAMTIGIDQFRNPHALRLDRMLAQPFKGTFDNYSINRGRGPVEFYWLQDRRD